MSQATNSALERQHENAPLEVVTEHGFRREEVETIKQTIAKGASDVELKVFLGMCRRLGLDPFARQIFLIKRYDQGREVMTPQVSIDGFRLVADRTEKYMPGREPTYQYEDGRLVSATAYVKKSDARGEWHEVAATAFYDEYVQKKRDGNPNAMWARMPRLMLSKCAESLALRKAFPNELSGVYTSDEMGSAEQATTQEPQPVAAVARSASASRDAFEASAEREQSGAGFDAEAEIIEDEEAAAIRDEAEGAQHIVTIDEQIAEEYIRLSSLINEVHAVAPLDEKAKYKPLPPFTQYVNKVMKVEEGLSSLADEQKAKLLEHLQKLRKQGAKKLNEFLNKLAAADEAK